MTTSLTVADAFSRALQAFEVSRPLQHIQAGKLTVPEYARILREVYFYTRENPQLQAAMTLHLTGRGRSVVKMNLKHSASAVGHDRLALQDLETLGFPHRNLLAERALPSTVALVSWPYYATHSLGPAAYLGHVYFLEHMPTSIGERLAGCMLKGGIPANALAFLREHVEADVSHNKLMQEYLRAIVVSEREEQDFAYSVQVTGGLYAAMLEGAIWASADHCGQIPNWREVDALAA